jgi:hypothetical protein
MIFIWNIFHMVIFCLSCHALAKNTSPFYEPQNVD